MSGRYPFPRYASVLTCAPSTIVTAPRPITSSVWSAWTIAHVSSSSPMPRSDGDCATTASSRPIRPRCSKCWSITTPCRIPSPADSCAIRFFGRRPRPAERHHVRRHRARAGRRAGEHGAAVVRQEDRVGQPRPGHDRGQPRLVPAREEHAGRVARALATVAGSSASSRSSGRRPVTRPIPRPRNSSRYSSVACSPSEEAVEITTTCPSGPPANSANRARIALSRILSSAPPITMTGPAAPIPRRTTTRP